MITNAEFLRLAGILAGIGALYGLVVVAAHLVTLIESWFRKGEQS